jgi:polysaccharide pyruvyl transferase WcaK-like protein
MRIHHFYPRTRNIGDHAVQRGIEQMVRTIIPEAHFELFDINSSGADNIHYGLTQFAVERANKEADLIIVGGSNLYEGGFRWPWGVHLEVEALKNLRAPLFLMGIGAGSDFASPLHQPSPRAKREIKLLNDYATFSGARDVITYEWLQQLGITKAKLTGDPATFIFNSPLRSNHNGQVLITMPPRRFWTSKRHFRKVRVHGRGLFRGLVELAGTLLEAGQKVVVACNDPLDLPTAESLFADLQPGAVVCPQTLDDYFQLLSASRAVVSARLHTAVVAFSLGIPFLLIDVDQRTHGFLKTYQLERWSIDPSSPDFTAQLGEKTADLLSEESSESWRVFIEKRDHLYSSSMDLLGEAFESIS